MLGTGYWVLGTGYWANSACAPTRNIFQPVLKFFSIQFAICNLQFFHFPSSASLLLFDDSGVKPIGPVQLVGPIRIVDNQGQVLDPTNIDGDGYGV